MESLDKLVYLKQKIAENLEIDIIEQPKDFNLLINNVSFKEIMKNSQTQKKLRDETSNQKFCEELDLGYLPTDNDTLRQARKEIIKNFYR